MHRAVDGRVIVRIKMSLPVAYLFLFELSLFLELCQCVTSKVIQTLMDALTKISTSPQELEHACREINELVPKCQKHLNNPTSPEIPSL